MVDREILDVVDSWTIQKTANRNFTQRDLRSFVETQNALTRRLISSMGKQDPAWWISLAELAQNAATLTTPKARIIADGIDRTNV